MSALKLSGLKKKKAGGKAKKEYPVLRDPEGEVAEMVANLCDLKAKLDQLEGNYNIIKGDLISQARSEMFGRLKSLGTMKAHAENGASVSISAQNRYYPINTTTEGPDGDEIENPRVTGLKRVMGEHFNRVMETGLKVEIDIEKVPESLRQDFIDYLVSGAQIHEADDAIIAKEVVKPKESFHLDRCELFSEEENHEINKHMPVTVMVRAKGVTK
jgi:hypothetical protein